MAEQGPPAGWYPHPSMAGTQRYWDGGRWTEHVAPGVAATATAPAQQGVSDGVLVLGYISSVMLPFVGFIVGVIALAKGRGGHGFAIMAISLLVFVLFLNAAANGRL